MMAITFVVILLSLTVTIISVSMWMFVQDFREIRRKVLMLEAKAEQTEPSTDGYITGEDFLKIFNKESE